MSDNEISGNCYYLHVTTTDGKVMKISAPNIEALKTPGGDILYNLVERLGNLPGGKEVLKEFGCIFDVKLERSK